MSKKEFAGASFASEYKKLNSKQKEAVDSIDGPIMVVAGPGTGKTQVLALRIANILNKTDIKADGVLCLTFTNSAVEAMKKRLERYIGPAAEKVNVFTFHSFGMKVIEEYYKVLGLKAPPKLLDDAERAILFDKILAEYDWEYLRPRGNSMKYFQDLKSLISLMKRERISKEDFELAVEKEIKFLEEDESNISTRGATKGEIKKDALDKIEGLKKSGEIVKFLEVYRKEKADKNLLDYDDVLESMVRIVEDSDDAASSLRERYLYILVDEHQDSSRVQNEFLARVWAGVEKPDIFVVGDDRQLIYGFSGASIEHFAEFSKTFKGAKIIPLVDNYRSTQIILDASHALLKSVMSKEKLVSHHEENHPIRLVEAPTPEEEIMAAGLDINKQIKEAGVDANDIAILVPKNKQVRKALDILHRLGVPVSTFETLNLFDQQEAGALLRVLKIIENKDRVALVMSFFDQTSGLTAIEASRFIASQNMRDFSLDTFLDEQVSLFNSARGGEAWKTKLLKWLGDKEVMEAKELLETIGRELFEETQNKNKIISGKEVADTFISLLEKELEKNSTFTLKEFVSNLEKLESLGEFIPVVSSSKEGVKVLTMHSSKGLEFDYVWIAHMDEKSLASGRRMAFTLPESIREVLEEGDIDAIKRKLFVAITRAKRFCRLSYSVSSLAGDGQELARIISELPEEVFQKEKTKATLEELDNLDLSPVVRLAESKYPDRYVSVSLLNNFFECPWKWYFENILQIPKEKFEVLEFGIAVHASVDKILKLEKAPGEKEIAGIAFEEVGRSGFGTERDRARMAAEVAKVVARWVKNRFREIRLSRKTEESISIKDADYPHLKIYGKIDLIENLGGKEVRVTDFKTGSAKRKSEIEKTDEEGRMSGNLRQLSMYAYLIRENTKWQADVRESRLEFIEAKNPKESFYDRVIKSGDIELLKKDIMDYDRLVKSGGWVNRECHFNSYGRNTECEYCRLAKVYNT